jgi:hypothetical protein
MKAILRLSLMAVLGAAIASASANAQSTQTTTNTTNKPAPPKKTAPATTDTAKSDSKSESKQKDKALPYHGTLTALDKNAGTMTVGKRTFQINSQTKFYKGEKTPATTNDGVVGEEARLSYIKTDDGKYVAHNVYFGAKAEKSSKKSSDKPKETTPTDSTTTTDKPKKQGQ